MIRFVHCVKARDDISENDFRAAFTSEKMHQNAKRIVGYTDAVSYRISLTLKLDINVGLQEERSGMEPFDGMIEVWWEDGGKLATLKDSPEGIEGEISLINDELDRLEARYDKRRALF